MSRGYCKIIIVGNLGADPEMRYTPSGRAVTNFSVAVNRRTRNSDGQMQDETDWYRVSAWERQAETADQYLRKGMKVLVEGELAPRQFTDQSGQLRTSLDIRFARFVMLNTREEADQIRASAGMDRAPATAGAQQQQSDQGNFDDYEDEDLDDVPF